MTEPAPATRTTALSLAARRAFGELLPVIDDPAIRDVLVQVRDQAGELWVDQGGTLRLVSSWRASPAEVRRLASSLIAAGGSALDELHPLGEVTLGDGIRVHCALPPVAAGGAVVSVRLPPVRRPVFSELVAAGLCNEDTARILQLAVSERMNLLITGGTGSGKTTTLAALLDLAAPHERIVTIEDSAELRLTHQHTVSLEARRANAEGSGEVTLAGLLREALRMRPDRIVLGECRGAEIATLLTALNTGHDGSAGTLHASRLREVPARLEALGALAGLSPSALARQAVAGVQLIVQLARTAAGHRVTGMGALRLDGEGKCGIEVRST